MEIYARILCQRVIAAIEKKDLKEIGVPGSHGNRFSADNEQPGLKHGCSVESSLVGFH